MDNSPAGTRKRILWVEDDEFLGGLIGQRLTQEQYVLFRASKGEDALRIAETEKPDIILLDILLPGMDGMEILKHLKENESTKHIPVIMFSNLNDAEKVEQSKALGAANFFVKAYVTLDEVLVEIQKTITA